MTPTWHRVAPGFWHARDARGFCGCVWKGHDGRWYPRTRDSLGRVLCLAVCETLRQAKRDLRDHCRELNEPWETLGEP